MNILFAHTFRRWGYSELFGKALSKIERVTPFNINETAYWADLKNTLPFYFPKGWPTSIQSLARKFGTEFDLVIEAGGGGQHHLTGSRKYPGPVVHWTVDEHEPVKRKFELYVKNDFDMLFVCHKDCLHLYQDVPHCWLPTAADPDVHKKMDLEKIYDVSFVGNLDPAVYPERVRLIDKLSKKFRVRKFHYVYEEEMVRILNQSRIVFHRSFCGDMSTRVFEALSCGAFLIGDRAGDGLTDYFQDGKHMALYGNYEELEEKTAYYLSHEEERKRIADEGHREFLARHTFDHRAQTLLAACADLKK